MANLFATHSILIPLLATFIAGLPQEVSADGGTRIAVISDINGTYGSTAYHQRIAKAVKRIIALQPDIVISTGDMVAGQRPAPRLQREELDSMWQSFHTQVREPLAIAGIPLLMTPGNHDASAYPGFELERMAFAAYHAAYPPALRPLPDGDFPFQFAVNFKGILLISMDATRSGPLSDTQRSWLRELLHRAPPQRATVLFGHLPLQPIAIGREHEVIEDPQLESLLQEAGVSAYLSGHHHAYYPGRRLGVSMLSIGNLGGNQRALIGTDSLTGFSFALLEFDEDGTMAVTAYSGTAFEQTIDNSTLPRELGTGTDKLQRLDLAPPLTGNDRPSISYRKLECSGDAMASPEACALSYGKIGFTVSATANSSQNQMVIKPRGLAIDNREIHVELDGTAYRAELADIDGNGWPEIYIYVSSAGSGSYGSLVAYAVNRGKSLSSIFLPPLEQSPDIASGYMGHDEFAVVENRLVRRFPLYRDTDVNASATGGTRQIQYRLEPGEAGWLLKVDRIANY